MTIELADAYRELRESHLSMLSVLDDTMQRNFFLEEELKTKDVNQLPISPSKDDSFDNNFFTAGAKSDKLGDVLDEETIRLKNEVPSLIQKNLLLESELTELKEAMEVSKKSFEYLRSDRDALKLELESLKKSKALAAREVEVSTATLEAQLAESKNDVKVLNNQLAESKNDIKALNNQLAESRNDIKVLNDQLARTKSTLLDERKQLIDLQSRLDVLTRELAEEKRKQQEARQEHDSLTMVERRQEISFPASEGEKGGEREKTTGPAQDNKRVEHLAMEVPKESENRDNILDDIVIVEDKDIVLSSRQRFETLGKDELMDDLDQPHFGGSPLKDSRIMELEIEVDHYREKWLAEQHTVTLLANQVKKLNLSVDDLKRLLYLQKLEATDIKLTQNYSRNSSPNKHQNFKNNHLLMELQIENDLYSENAPTQNAEVNGK